MSEITTSGGGFHSGAPIIWPSVRSSSAQTQNTEQGEEAQQTEQKSPVRSAQQAAGSEQVTQTVLQKHIPQTRALTVNDVRAHLISLSVLDSEENVSLASQMLRHGLELSKEKTRITRIEEGFDFLGFEIRKYRNEKLLIKPSKANVKSFLAEFR